MLQVGDCTGLSVMVHETTSGFEFVLLVFGFVSSVSHQLLVS